MQSPEGNGRSRAARAAYAVTFVLALTIGLSGAGVLYTTQAFADGYHDRVLPGVQVAGVELGGKDRAEALAAVEVAIDPKLDRQVTVRWEDHAWETTPRELGAETDAEAVVDDALGVSDDASLSEMARMRWLGEELDVDNEVAITHSP
jgi:hypothetical protein